MMDKSQIEQIKQENAIAAAKGLKFLKIALTVIGAALLVLGVWALFGKGSKGFAVFELVCGAIFVGLGLLIKAKKPEEVIQTSSLSPEYVKDLSEIETTVRKIDDLVGKERLKSEFGYISDIMHNDLQNANQIAAKLTNLNKVIENEASDKILSEAKNKLVTAESAPTPDDFVVKTLKEQISSIELMKSNKLNLEMQFQKIKQNISNVYTKLIVVDTNDTANKDEALSDLQKTLDLKISAQKFEKDL